MRREYARTLLEICGFSRINRPTSKKRAWVRQLTAESLETRNMLSGAGLADYLATTSLVSETPEGEDSAPAVVADAAAAGETACAAGAPQQADAATIDAVLNSWAGPVDYTDAGEGEDPFDPDPVDPDPVDPDPVDPDPTDPDPTDPTDPDPIDEEDPIIGMGTPPTVVSATWELQGGIYFISGSVTDDEDLEGCAVRFEVGLEGSTSIDADWDFYFSVEGWTEGPPSSIDIIATDSDGNDSAVYTMIFIV